MSGNSHTPYPLKPVRIPEKKPDDFRATSQKQSNAGFYDDRGGDLGGNRLKNALIWAVLVAIVAVIVTFIVDALSGRALL